jgi:hypothetical protein
VTQAGVAVVLGHRCDRRRFDRYGRPFLRRFDLENTLRLFKQTLGWTVPKIRTPQAADRWTWLVIAAHTQLRLAHPLDADHARPGRDQPRRAG